MKKTIQEQTQTISLREGEAYPYAINAFLSFYGEPSCKNLGIGKMSMGELQWLNETICRLSIGTHPSKGINTSINSRRESEGMKYTFYIHLGDVLFCKEESHGLEYSMYMAMGKYCTHVVMALLNEGYIKTK